MNLSRHLLAATAAFVTMGGTAFAADPIIIPPPAPPPPMAVVAPAFAGPYWGSYGGVARTVIGGGVPVGVVGTQFGYNFGNGNLRFGFEIESEYYAVGIPVVSGTLSGRAGFVINNRILAYGQVGIGTLVVIPTLSYGGGVEFMLNSGLVVFAEAKMLTALGGGGPVGFTFRGGVNYYAGTDNHDAAGNFDWDGLYFGGHVSYTNTNPPISAGVQVGYNFANDRFLWGVEVETGHIVAPATPFVHAALNARAGFLLSDRMLAYGEVGIGTYATTPVITAGGGVEFALGDKLSVFGEGLAIFVPGGGGIQGVQGTVGVNIHFGP